jgi:hypothetical protein
LVCWTAATEAEQIQEIPGTSREGALPRESIRKKQRYAVRKGVLTFNFLVFYSQSDKYATIH